MGLKLIHPTDDDPPPLRGGLMRLRCERVMQTSHLRAARTMTRKPKAFYSIATGEQGPWKVQMRRIIELVEGDVPRAEVLAIAIGYAEVITCLCDARDVRKGRPIGDVLPIDALRDVKVAA